MKGKLYYALALLTLGVTSCKDEIKFDQEAYDKSIKQAFVVENVDPSHNWATVGTANASITINDVTSGEYTVNIYKDYPAVGTTPVSLCEGKVENGGTLNMTFSYPTSEKTLYVAAVDKNGHRQVKIAELTNGSVECLFGERSGSQRAPHRASTTGNAYSVPAYNAPDVSAYNQGTVISDATNRTDEVDTYYLLNSDWTGVFLPLQSGSISINSPVNVYVTAKWTINAEQRVNGGCNVIVANGGEIVINGGAALSTNDDHNYSGMIYVMPGGKISGDGLLAFNNATEGIITTYSYNGGEINVGTINLNGGTLYNAANAQLFADELLGGATGSRLINQGNAHIGNAGNDPSQSFTNAGLQIWNACQLIVDDHLNLGGESRIDDGGYVECGTLYAGGFTHLAMGHNAVMNVVQDSENAARTGDVKFVNFGIQGPTSGTTGKAIVIFENTTQTTSYTAGNRETYIFNYVELVIPSTYDVQNSYSNIFRGMMNGLNWGYGENTIADSEKNVTISQETPSYTIDVSDCSKGVPSGSSGTVESKSFSMRYCFEDNFPEAGDYDFNDVVMTMTPTLNDKTLTLKVSLDAVGATKTIGAAIRLIGVKTSDLESYTVTKGFTALPGNLGENYANIKTDKTFLPENESPNNTSSMVIVLFKDAHWAINPNLADDGSIQNVFYNTVKRDVASNKAYVDPQEATYTLVFKDADKAKTMLKENLYDVFIVEPYNGAFWEVHTVQNGFKTAQVITSLKPKNAAGKSYDEAYGSNMPWAIMVPSDFKYPVEWQVIGRKTNSALTGAYKEPQHSFGEWAEDSKTATDWYLHPSAGLVFE